MAWGVTFADLSADDHARCQEVALAARDAEYEAIQYPSTAVASGDEANAADARSGDPARSATTANLAVFADRLHPGSDGRVVRSDVLPLDD